MQAVVTKIKSKVLLPVFKYVYLLTFFALLAGFFYPIIRQISFDANILAIFVLFVGTAGGVVIYKSTETEYPSVLLSIGLVLIGISLYMVFLISGRLQ